MAPELMKGTITGEKYWVWTVGSESIGKLHLRLSYAEYKKVMAQLGVQHQDDPVIAEQIKALLLDKE